MKFSKRAILLTAFVAQGALAAVNYEDPNLMLKKSDIDLNTTASASGFTSSKASYRGSQRLEQPQVAQATQASEGVHDHEEPVEGPRGK